MAPERAHDFAERVKKRGLAVATQAACAENKEEILCRFFSAAPARSRPQNVSRAKSIGSRATQRGLAGHKFSELTGASVGDVIQGAKRLKGNELNSVVAKLSSEEGCRSSELYVGVAAVLELEFPSPEKVSDAKALLRKSALCNRDELAKYGQYRLGIFGLWGRDCDAAERDLGESMEHPQNPYRARAVYWQKRCQTRSKRMPAQELSAFYARFPLSLYPLLKAEGERFDAYEKVMNNPETALEVRSPGNRFLNDGLELAEVFSDLRMPYLAGEVFERLDLADVQRESPGLQLYFAYLLSGAGRELSVFQLLSNLLGSNHELKTESSMKLYYPLKYLDQVRAEAGDLDPFLILSLIRQESAFNPRARSSKRAAGLMQIMPSLARSYGYSPSEMFDPDKNIKVGVRFFRRLLERYNGNVQMALAAYNAGPLMADAWLRRYPTEDPILFMELIPFRETREYVAVIMRNWYWYSNLYSDDSAAYNRYLQSKI